MDRVEPGRRARRPGQAITPRSTPFFAVHVLAIAGVLYYGWSWSGFLLAVALYYARMFFLTAGYHRYFSHRSYKMSRPAQFLMALGGTSCAQKGPLWWAAHHRHHHKYSDQPEDVHSLKLRGFYWSHVGWILSDEWEGTNRKAIPDLLRYPELVWLEQYWWIAPIALAVGLFLAGGVHALLWGFFVSTVLLWHGTFTINSLSHRFGSRRYATTDESRNNWLLALITMGEGWHNNHHHYMTSERQGFFWWEVDASHYLLRALSWIGVVRDLREPPSRVLAPPAPMPATPAPVAPSAGMAPLSSPASSAEAA